MWTFSLYFETFGALHVNCYFLKLKHWVNPHQTGDRPQLYTRAGSVPTFQSLVRDGPPNTIGRVDGHVAQVSQGGRQLDEQVTSQNSHGPAPSQLNLFFSGSISLITRK